MPSFVCPITSKRISLTTPSLTSISSICIKNNKDALNSNNLKHLTS